PSTVARVPGVRLLAREPDPPDVEEAVHAEVSGKNQGQPPEPQPQVGVAVDGRVAREAAGMEAAQAEAGLVERALLQAAPAERGRVEVRVVTEDLLAASPHGECRPLPNREIPARVAVHLAVRALDVPSFGPDGSANREQPTVARVLRLIAAIQQEHSVGAGLAEIVATVGRCGIDQTGLVAARRGVARDGSHGELGTALDRPREGWIDEELVRAG